VSLRDVYQCAKYLVDEKLLCYIKLAMDRIFIVNGTVVLPNALLKNAAVLIKGKKIVSVGRKIRPPKGAAVIDAEGGYVSPGFIDTHIHGSPGHIFENETSSGTTAIVIAESCAPLDKILRKIRTIESFAKKDRLGPSVLGVRVEGPYISREKAGAQDRRYIKAPDEKEARRFIKSCGPLLKMMTIAPEIIGTDAIIKLLKASNVIASLGHSNATCKDAELGIKSGANHATHIFNAMSGPDKHRPGLSDALLTSGKVYAEVILDLIHVHKALFRLLIKEKGVGKTVLVTDSVRAEYESYPQRRGRLNVPYIREADGIYRLEDGTIAGSALTMIGAVKNAVRACGMRLTDAVRMAAANPAKLLGLERQKGALLSGMDADIVIFDEDFNVKTTIISGEIVYNKER